MTATTNARNLPHFDLFLVAYLEAALFSTTDESRDDGGDPLDDNYSADDIAPRSLEYLSDMCERFLTAAMADIESADRPRAAVEYSALEQAGHDFWMTQNGHGCGFWDGDWSEPQASRLTSLAESFGEVNMYVGYDGVLYVMGAE